MLRRVLLLIFLFTTPLHAGVLSLDENAEEGMSDAQWLARMVSAVQGLDGPLFAAPDLPPAACAPGRRGVTRGIFVAADAFSDEERLHLRGPVNDGEILRSVLVGKGAKAENIRLLQHGEASLAGLERAAQETLSETDCGDSVILQFSGFTFGAPLIALTEDGSSPFSLAPKIKRLTDLGGDPFKSGVADHILTGAPYIPLNPASPSDAQVLSAAALSELVTLFRNRGADVAVLLDVGSARAFRLEERQAAVDAARLTWVSIDGRTGDGWPRSTLDPQAGALTVFYGTELGDSGSETRFPKGQAEDKKVYGAFSYGFARALATSESGTIGAIMRAIQSLPSSAMSSRPQDYTFASTNPDLDLVAEARPDAALDDTRIIIDSPEPTRAAVARTRPEIEIRGRILSRGAPINVEVNGAAAQLDPAGAFRATLRLTAGVNRITVFAMTRENEAITHSFEVFYEGDILETMGKGRSYAVLIANQDYADGSGIPDLATPIGDAQALAQILRDTYGFATEIALPGGETLDLMLTDASARDIGLTLDRLARAVGERDNVLVFYAGHGEYEQLTGAAYWLPVDAVAGAFSTYLEASSITRSLQRMGAGNVLVISDSCYSGMLLRSASAGEPPPAGDRLQALQRLNDQRSRVVMSSGGNTPVLDGGGGGHSVFAAALLEELRAPEDRAFSARELHGRVFSRVIRAAAQEPDFRPIDGAGHDGGDFVFIAQTQP
ncbi:MAG: caspase family protein [Pseudomonadota bacterium]